MNYKYASLITFLLQVLLLRLITPLSYLFLITVYILYVLYGVTAPTDIKSKLLYYVIGLWATAEAVFFPYYYYLFVKISNTEAKGSHFAQGINIHPRF